MDKESPQANASRPAWFGFFAGGLCLIGARASAVAPLALVQSHFGGFPALICFLLMAMALPGWKAGNGPASALFILGLMGASTTLLFPFAGADGLRWPLSLALEAIGTGSVWLLAGLALLVCTASLTMGWIAVLGRPEGRPDATRKIRPVHKWIDPTVNAGPAALGMAQLAMSMGSGNAGDAFLGILQVILMGLVFVLGRSILSHAPTRFPPWPGRMPKSVVYLPPFLVTAGYLLLEIHGMGPSDSDENIYFYMAKAVSQGRWPYADFFFAHPPVKIFLPGALFAVTGFSMGLAKAVAPLAMALSGLVVWSIGKRAFGTVAAGLAMGAFLFCQSALESGSIYTGMELTVLFLLLSLRQCLLGKGWAAGLWAGLAAVTGVYSMAGACAILLIMCFRDRLLALRMLGGFAAIFLPINLGFRMVAGDAFLDSVYRFHGLKAFADPRMQPLWGEGFPPWTLLGNLGVVLTGPAFVMELHHYAHLWLALPASLLLSIPGTWPETNTGQGRMLRFLSLGWLRSGGHNAAALILALICCAFILQFALFHELYAYYFLPVYPFLALLFGFTLRRAAGALIPAFSRPDPGMRRRLLPPALALSMIAFSHTLAAWAHAPRPEEGWNARIHAWSPAPVAPSLSGTAKAWFWDSLEIVGSVQPGYRRFLWERKDRPLNIGPLADYIRSHSDPGETLAGSSTITPLIALAADRRLAAGEADNNGKRFETGILREKDYWNSICSDAIKFIISSNGGYFNHQLMKNTPAAGTWFKPIGVFPMTAGPAEGESPWVLFMRSGDLREGGMVCRWEGE